jgi:hypothetical protein
MSSLRFRAALARWEVAWIRASGPVMGRVRPILGTSLRATAGHLLPRLLPASRRRRPWLQLVRRYFASSAFVFGAQRPPRSIGVPG